MGNGEYSGLYMLDDIPISSIWQFQSKDAGDVSPRIDLDHQ
jgi:hypothetical protein